MGRWPTTAGMQEVEQRRERSPTTAGMQEVEQRRERWPSAEGNCVYMPRMDFIRCINELFVITHAHVRQAMNAGQRPVTGIAKHTRMPRDSD
jgi:hypothetical protein